MEMEEINLSELFGFFIKKIWLIIVIVMVILVLGLTYSIFIRKPLYSSNVSIILVNKDSGQTAASIQSDLIVNQKLVSTYKELVTSRRVLKQVKENLDLDYSVDQLANMIVVSNVGETEMIRISVNSEKAVEAKKIADETAEIFKKEIVEIYNLQNVSIIDGAELAKAPYNVNFMKDAIIYIMVGLVLACGLVFTVYYFDNTVKSTEQIESRLGVPVIGTIPVIRKKGTR